MAATTAFGPIPAFLAERFQTSIRNSASGFAYNGGLLVGSWADMMYLSRCLQKKNKISMPQ